jgi:3-oxoadipate enol-lactonase
MADIGEIRVHYALRGRKDAPALVFANALGTDYHIWNGVMNHLPAGLRILRFDLRGHGLSTAPDGPYFMGDLVSDTARIMEHAGVKDAVFVGLSLGGVVAQGLAAERPDLVRALVLSHTAAKIGTPETWRARIDEVEAGGIGAIADGTMERWFARETRRDRPELVEGLANMLTRTPKAGYLGCMEALAETDLRDSTAALRLPTLGIASSEDGSTPADLVRETVDSIPGSKFEIIRRTGHMACVEKPAIYGAVLTQFLRAVGQVA